MDTQKGPDHLNNPDTGQQDKLTAKGHSDSTSSGVGGGVVFTLPSAIERKSSEVTVDSGISGVHNSTMDGNRPGSASRIIIVTGSDDEDNEFVTEEKLAHLLSEENGRRRAHSFNDRHMSQFSQGFSSGQGLSSGPIDEIDSLDIPPIVLSHRRASGELTPVEASHFTNNHHQQPGIRLGAPPLGRPISRSFGEENNSKNSSLHLLVPGQSAPLDVPQQQRRIYPHLPYSPCSSPNLSPCSSPRLRRPPTRESSKVDISKDGMVSENIFSQFIVPRALQQYHSRSG